MMHLYKVFRRCTVVIEIIQPPLQIRFIGKMYRLSAICNDQIKQKYWTSSKANVSDGFCEFNWKCNL